MALWKPFLGNRTSLDSVPKHSGYVYWCADDGSLHFDYTDADGVVQRKQINAKEAEKLIGYEISTVLRNDNQEIATSKAVFDALSGYYTKIEIDNMEFITVDEIDAICGETIEVATSEVKF